jgi:hypothetical protein
MSNRLHPDLHSACVCAVCPHEPDPDQTSRRDEHRAPLGRLDLLAAMAINIRPLRGLPPYGPLAGQDPPNPPMVKDLTLRGQSAFQADDGTPPAYPVTGRAPDGSRREVTRGDRLRLFGRDGCPPNTAATWRVTDHVLQDSREN